MAIDTLRERVACQACGSRDYGVQIVDIENGEFGRDKVNRHGSHRRCFLLVVDIGTGPNRWVNRDSVSR